MGMGHTQQRAFASRRVDLTGIFIACDDLCQHKRAELQFIEFQWIFANDCHDLVSPRF